MFTNICYNFAFLWQRYDFSGFSERSHLGTSINNIINLLLSQVLVYYNLKHCSCGEIKYRNVSLPLVAAGTSTCIVPAGRTNWNNSIILVEDAQSKSTFPLLISQRLLERIIHEKYHHLAELLFQGRTDRQTDRQTERHKFCHTIFFFFGGGSPSSIVFSVV